MAESSSESIVMTLLEQVRCLEDERDKALQLANSLNEKLQEKESGATKPRQVSSSEQNFKDILETLTYELEGIRLNEEQRQFNLSELVKEKGNKVEDPGGGDKEMVKLYKQYYGKMVSDLQEERRTLQQKVEKLQSELIEKDMKIAELEINKIKAH